MILPNGFMFPSKYHDSEWDDLLHLTDCELPCWIGIVPVETTIGAAVTLIKQVYGSDLRYLLEYRLRSTKIATDSRIVVTDTLTNYKLRVELSSYEGDSTWASIIDHISLTPFVERGSVTWRPRVSEIQVILGEPLQVRLASGIDNYAVSLVYQDGLVFVAVPDLKCDRVLPTQEVTGIGIAAQIPPEVWWPSKPQLWRGYNVCYNFESRATY